MTVAQNREEIILLKQIVQQNSDTNKKLSKVLLGNGDGISMGENIRKLRDDVDEIKQTQAEQSTRIGVIESDVRATKNRVDVLSGYSDVRYDKKHHPGRRQEDTDKHKTWYEKAWEKSTDKISEKFFTAVFIYILINLPEVFKKFLEILP